MWSLIQHRRLRQQVETPLQASSNRESGVDAGGPAIEKGEQSELSPGLHPIYVRTTGDDDPLDPRNWPLLHRSKNIAILSLLVFTQAWAGAAGSMANAAVSTQMGVSQVAENLSIAMYLFGIGAGALVAGPVSETVGRNPTYLVSTFCYLCFVLGVALVPTFGGRIVCRFCVGLFASATLTINGSSVKDQFRPVKRAFVFPVIAWANVTGKFSWQMSCWTCSSPSTDTMVAPVIASIASGWIVDNPRLGWRWTEWITLIISAFAFLMALIFLPETYLPVLLKWKAANLRRVTGDGRYVSDHAESASFSERIRRGIILPAKFFVTEPVITVLGIYLVLLYVLLFTFLSGFDYIFKGTYGLSTSETGSCFGAIAAGATAFTLFAPGLYSWAREKTEHVRGASVTPEFRLWPAIIAGPLLPIALFWLGWGNYSSIPVWCSLGACFLFGAVLIAIYVSSYEYIIDSYGEHAATALSSITMLRYIIAGGMVVATRPLYGGIGVHWTMTLLGCIAVILAPAPLIFWRTGANLRKKSPYAKSPDDEKS